MAPENRSRKSGGEVLELVKETAQVEQYWVLANASKPHKPPQDYNYIEELTHLQIEVIKMQEWVKLKRLKLCVLFEGRDAAGKGGVIKQIVDPLNPRVCRVVALSTPTEKERGQWYFQRYVAQLPSAGEIVLFDRSWYNRAGVEHVMGFCTDDDYREFLRACPLFEEMLIRSGIILVKYWFSVNDEVQEVRFQDRMRNPIKRWKLSAMDIEFAPALGGLFTGEGSHAGRDRYHDQPMVRGEFRQQEESAVELHRAFAVADSIPGHDPGGDRPAAATIGFWVQAAEIHEPAFRARVILRAHSPHRQNRRERHFRLMRLGHDMLIHLTR